jgi:hypothetical protein
MRAADRPRPRSQHASHCTAGPELKNMLCAFHNSGSSASSVSFTRPTLASTVVLTVDLSIRTTDAVQQTRYRSYCTSPSGPWGSESCIEGTRCPLHNHPQHLCICPSFIATCSCPCSPSLSPCMDFPSCRWCQESTYASLPAPPFSPSTLARTSLAHFPSCRYALSFQKINVTCQFLTCNGVWFGVKVLLVTEYEGN